MRSYPHAPSHSHKPRPHAKGWDKKVRIRRVGFWLRRKGRQSAHSQKQTQHAKCNHKHDNEGGNKLQSTTTTTHTHTRAEETQKNTQGHSADRQMICVLWAVPCPCEDKCRAEVEGAANGIGSGSVDLASYLLAYMFAICGCVRQVYDRQLRLAQNIRRQCGQNHSSKLGKDIRGNPASVSVEGFTSNAFLLAFGRYFLESST